MKIHADLCLLPHTAEVVDVFKGLTEEISQKMDLSSVTQDVPFVR